MINPLEPDNLKLLNEYGRAAPQFGLRLMEVSTRSPTDLDAAFAELQRVRPDAVIVLGNAVTLTHRKVICERLAAAKIPSMSGYTVIVEAGCLFGYLSLIGDYTKEQARYVDQVLRGVNPADLPVTQPTRFELVVNTKAAKALGLVVPQTLLMRADRVIE
jgi:putative tryptophan/tyrosine transport system substrate-binding protein